MNFTVRVLSILFFFIISISLFLKPAFAQTIPVNTNPDVPNNFHTWTQNLMIEVTSSLSCMLAGIDPMDRSRGCLGFDQKTGKIGYVNNGGGAIGGMGSLIAMTFTPPASSNDFLHYLSSNFGIAKPTYAQGLGFEKLTPLLDVWIGFRNIVYLLFVIIFVAIGFAIMLRVHIDPRTVMTVENQIPKIIIALILVTFSFAIAGFLIDLMYVFIYLSIEAFKGVLGPTALGNNFGNIQGQNPFDVANNAFGNLQDLPRNAAGGVKDIVQGIFHVEQHYNDVFLITGILKTIDTVTNVAGWLGGIIAGGIALIVIEIALLFALFRLWFQLIMAYVFILMDVVFAPFWILMGLMPGTNLSFSTWFRHLLAYLAAFPATVIMFLLGVTFMNKLGGSGNMAFVPPLIGNPGDNPNALGSLIALGIILTTPNIVTMMAKALKAPQFDFAPIGQAIGVGTGAITSGIASVAAYNRKIPKPDEPERFQGVLGRLFR